MLPRRQRLSESSAVLATVRRGEYFNTPDLRIVALTPTNTRGGTKGRWTVVVSKKISKRAVVRNRLKRRAREALAGLPVPDNCWGVVFPKLSVGTIPFVQLQEQIAQWLAQWTKKKSS